MYRILNMEQKNVFDTDDLHGVLLICVQFKGEYNKEPQTNLL